MIPVVLMSATPVSQGVVAAPLLPTPFDCDALPAQVTHPLTIYRRYLVLRFLGLALAGTACVPWRR